MNNGNSREKTKEEEEKKWEREKGLRIGCLFCFFFFVLYSSDSIGIYIFDL